MSALAAFPYTQYLCAKNEANVQAIAIAMALEMPCTLHHPMTSKIDVTTALFLPMLYQGITKATTVLTMVTQSTKLAPW